MSTCAWAVGGVGEWLVMEQGEEVGECESGGRVNVVRAGTYVLFIER